MLRQSQLAFRRGAVGRAALGVLLIVAFLVAGCGGTAAPTPRSTPTVTATPSLTATPTPAGFHALVVVDALKGPGTVVQQTEIAAIDAVTGHQLWARTVTGLPGPFVPARAGNTLVVPVSMQASPYPASQLAAFDIRTGEILWSHSYGPNTQAAVGTTGAAIIVVTSAVSTAAPGAAQGLSIAALNSTNGSQLWQRMLAHQELYAPIQSGNGLVYVLGGQPSGTDTAFVLTAMDATTGVPHWQTSLGTGSLLGAVAGDGKFYVGLYPAHLAALRHTERSGALATSPLSPFAASTLTALSASDGIRAWQVTGFAAPQVEVGALLYATTATLESNGQVAFALLALKTSNGAQLWQSSKLGQGDPNSKPFAGADLDVVYAFAMPRTVPGVQALRATTGRSLWNALTSATVQAAAIGPGMLFTLTVPATLEGQPPQPAHVTITALRAATGAIQWSLVLEQSQTAKVVFS